jgi:hypothetical protein
MRTRLSRLGLLVATGALALSAAAPVSAASSDAMIRVLHGSPDAPSVDVLVNGTKVSALSGITFGQFSNSGNYVEVAAGTYSIKVCATADNTVCPIGPIDLTFEAGKKYTIAASDLLASIDANVFVDSPTPVDGKALARVVHLSADTPAVDVLTQDKSATVVDNLAYPKATAGYLELAPGSYDLIVCADADNSVCPLDPGALNLESGRAYTVWAIGSLTGKTLTAAVSVDGLVTPATDTVPAGNTGFAGLLVLVAAVTAFAAALRFAPVRARN